MSIDKFPHGHDHDGAPRPLDDEGACAPLRLNWLAQGLVVVRLHHSGQARATKVHRRAGGDRHLITQWTCSRRITTNGPAGGSRGGRRRRRRMVSAPCILGRPRQWPREVPICFMPFVEAPKRGRRMKSRCPGRRQSRAALSLSRRAGGVPYISGDYQPSARKSRRLGTLSSTSGKSRTSRPRQRTNRHARCQRDGQMVDKGEVLRRSTARAQRHHAEFARRTET